MERKKRILLVEDDIAIRKAYREGLINHGYLVETAANGQEGLQSMSLLKPDLILLDILMPVMDGLTMMGQVRDMKEWGAHVPIILLTNLTADEEKMMKTIIKYNPSFYLEKSNFDLSQVIEKIESCLTASPQ